MTSRWPFRPTPMRRQKASTGNSEGCDAHPASDRLARQRDRHHDSRTGDSRRDRRCRAAARRWSARPRLHLMGVMVAIALVLMLAHMIEIVVWSLSYALVGAAPAGNDLLYFAFVNYTTLGYGDVTPVKAWQLLGPMAAMNGILMFGWSAAVLFEVLLKTIEHLGAIAAPGTPFSAEDR